MTVDDYLQHNDPAFTTKDSGLKSHGGRCNRSLNHQPAARPNKRNWYFQNKGRDEPHAKVIPTTVATDSSEILDGPHKPKVKKTLWKKDITTEEIIKFIRDKKDSQLKSNLRSLIQQEKTLIKSQMPSVTSAKQKKPSFDFFFMQNTKLVQSQSVEKQIVTAKYPKKKRAEVVKTAFVDRGVLFMKRLEDDGTEILIN